jgi:signal transduction histidine kinase
MGLAHPDDLERARHLLADISKGAPVDIPEVRLRHKSGRWVHVEGAARMVTDPDGNSVILATTRDITEHRRAEVERRRLLGRLVAAQEQERTRIADDIHDDPIQVMTAAGMRLSMLRTKLEESPERDEVEKLEEVVERAIGRLRHLLFELHPPALDREGLAGAIGDYLRALIDEMGMDFVFHVDDRLTEEPPPDIRVVCYRIVQEALVNVRKHASAGRVVVTLETIEGGTRVRVDDDGVGVAPDLQTLPGHLGLGGMRERAELAGGWFRIGPREGAGTTLEFWTPNAAADQVD